jgi:hypothetical protein
VIAERKLTEKMKKYWKLLVLVCMVLAFPCGCKDKEKNSNNIEYIVDDLPTAGKTYGEEETEQIEAEITRWAEDYLLVDSDSNDEDKKIIKKALEASIVSDEEREKVMKDWKKFYEDADVKVGLVETEIKSAYKVEYKGQNYGRVECNVKIYGTRNRDRFRRNYTLKLVLNHGEPTGVKEIENISW